MTRTKNRVAAGWLAALLLSPIAAEAPRAATLAAPAGTDRADGGAVIVKYKAGSGLVRMQALSASGQRSLQAQALGDRLGVALEAGAAIGERVQVLRASGMSSAALAARIAADADIEYAVPDERKRIVAVPNDPFYPARAYNNPVAPTSGGPLVGQWYLKPPGPAGTAANTAPAAINAELAWDLTIGSAGVVVAVLDTGILRNHPDFGTNVLPGYDMISNAATAGDGDGRDPDPTDPGDFVSSADQSAPGCDSSDVGTPSSWHGTETAGLVAALTDNGLGMASVGRNVRVLPVRALGKCGGSDSDILAAIRWAAGLAVPGVPLNANPARVINLSLGSVGSCTAAYVDAVREANAAGAVVVAAAGNSVGRAVGTPANCPGVIAVAAVRHVGTKVGFSDLGPEIALAAPGGNCVNELRSQPCLYSLISLKNDGSTVAANFIYSDAFNTTLGTSFAAPLVAGAAGLMLSAQPGLSVAEVRAGLQASARAFPKTGADNGSDPTPVVDCVAPGSVDQVQCYCTTALCGAGMLDAHGAVQKAQGVQARIAVTTASPVEDQPVVFTSSSLIAAGSVSSYLWSITSAGGTGAAITAGTTATGSTFSVTPTAAGTFTVSLRTTDSNGNTTQTTQAVTVAAAPETHSGGGGGGGAVGAGWLALLAAATLALSAIRVLERRRAGAAARRPRRP